MVLIEHKWVVFASAFSVSFFNFGLPASMGAMYVGMLDTFNAGRAKTALVQSLVFAFCLGFGVISGFLVSKFGIKVVTPIAAILTATGFFLSFFATSIYQLYGFISVITVKMLLCNVCGRSFKSRSGLLDHERRHNNKAPYRCCGHNFFSRSHLIRHRCSAHGLKKMFKCRNCHKEFAIEGDKRRHEDTADCGGRFKCDTCGSFFHRQSDLREHMDKHSGDKRFRCACGKVYRYHSGLSRHRKTCNIK